MLSWVVLHGADNKQELVILSGKGSEQLETMEYSAAAEDPRRAAILYSGIAWWPLPGFKRVSSIFLLLKASWIPRSPTPEPVPPTTSMPASGIPTTF